jgi:outer membrane protein assembly factor BamA
MAASISATMRGPRRVALGSTEFDEDIGSIDGLDTQRKRDANLHLAALYDTRDAAALPTRGVFAKLSYTSSGSWLGGEQSYDVIEGVASRATCMGQREPC